MTDFMISYAATDASFARQVAEELRGLNRTVWLDDEGANEDTRQLIGLPGGQEHWSVISSAITEASTFLIIETPQWHSRSYCERELSYARQLGKRVAAVLGPAGPASRIDNAVAIVPATKLATMLAVLVPGDDVARAHARLLRDMASPRRRGFLLSAEREQAGDAELVATMPPTEYGLSVNPQLSAYCQSVTRRWRDRRRTLTAAVAVTVALLMVISVVAVVARHTTEVGRTTAKNREDYAQALLTAQSAEQAQSTAQALTLARQAVALDDEPATRAALARIEATAGYLMTTTTPSGLLKQTAVSDDGSVLLITHRRAIVVARPETGSVRTVAVAVDLGRRLALSPDGATGYAVSANGTLLCLDTRTATVHQTSVTGVVDLNASDDGRLWWLSQSGRLYVTTACGIQPSAPVASGLDSVQAFGVDPADKLVVTLTSDNHVLAYRLPSGKASWSSTPVWTADIAKLAKDAETYGTGLPDNRELGSVQFCAHTVHVLAGVKYSLPASTHAAFTVDGTPLGPRTMNVFMIGVGCGPYGTAWASPMVTPNAIPLPSTAYDPAGVVDSRDRGSANVVANSPDGSHTAIVHTDGRAQVLDVASAPWDSAAANVAVAVPIQDALITVDENGAANLRAGATTVALGSVGGTPYPQTVGLSDRAVIAVGSTVLTIDRAGVHTLYRAAAPVSSLATSLGGDRIIVETGNGWSVVPVGGGSATPLVAPRLPNDDMVFTVQLDGTHALWNTHYGKLVIADPDGTIRHETDLGVGGVNVAAFTADHSVAAMGGDGLLRLYSPSLQAMHTVYFGAGPVSIHSTPDGRVLLLGLDDFSVWAVDPSSLQALDQLEIRSADVRLAVPAPDDRTAVILYPAGSEPAHLEVRELTSVR